MYGRFTFVSFLQRWVAALALVLVTYNPLKLSYSHWIWPSAGEDWQENLPLKALAGVVLLIGYIIFVRATWRSVGVAGLMLIVALFAAITWVLFFYGILNFNHPTLLTWGGLVILATILAIGLSWSHVRRRLSGQIDTDDVDDT